MARPETYGAIEQVMEIYAGVWGAAADTSGVNYWVGEIDAGNLSYVDTAASFFAQELVQARYLDESDNPLTGDALLSALYQNIFKVETPDTNGFEYWQGNMSDLGITDYNSPNIGVLVMQMIDGMWASDEAASTQALYQNWITASVAFYNQQQNLGIDYSALSPAEQEEFLTAARSLVEDIDDGTDAEDIQAAVDQAIVTIVGDDNPIIQLNAIGDSVTATAGLAETFVLSFDSSGEHASAEATVVTIERFDVSEDQLRFDDTASPSISAADFLDVAAGGALIYVDQFDNSTVIGFYDPDADNNIPAAEITLQGILDASLGGDSPFFEIA